MGTSGQPFVPDFAPVKQSTSQTEKKSDKRSAAKAGKSHVKVIKRNLIQSSELASRDLTLAAGAGNRGSIAAPDARVAAGVDMTAVAGAAAQHLNGENGHDGT